MSIETIRAMSREAGAKASREKRKPFVFWPEDFESLDAGDYAVLKKIPQLGDYVPRGWEPMDLVDELELDGKAGMYAGALFVDKTGYGYSHEPALTLGQFIHALEDIDVRAQKMGITVGYGIIEEGQFQLNIGVFKKAE